MPIRVFISSTFRDMHAERDYLSRLVFPELRSRCQKRGAEFIGLDLRWGVTQEEAQREGALKICLDEIERCRPFFVCLLGSRYGWVPPLEEVPPERFADAVRGAPSIALADWYTLDETSVPPVYRLRRDRPVPEDVAETLARFWEHAGLPAAGESITAREILRGVFEEGFKATHALFYLRKPGVEADKAFPPAFVPVFVEPDPNRRAKLHDLETKIRKCKDPMVVRDYDAAFAGLRIEPSLLPDALSDEERAGIKDGAVAADKLDRFSAPVRQVILDRGTVEPSGLETLGDQILEDLWTAIEKELERPVEVLDGHQRERAYHERFVIDRTRLFLGRDEIVKRILDGLTDPAGGDLLAVSGEPGSGKSALLAECVRQARERFQGALVVPHFIGASPGSAFLANTLRSICETLKRECGLTEEVPADPQKLLQQWPEFLEKAGARKRVILLLDALNQLDPLDHSHELGWVPYRIPQGVTLVVSALPSECLDRLRYRVSGEAVIDVPVLAEPDRLALVEAHLWQRGKKLSRAQLDRLLDTTKRPEAGRPLYLLVALEELSLFGSYEALGKRIELLPPTVAELFDQVLKRLEHDHGRDMTESICRWIAVSRSGMLESEILDLLAGREQAFPPARWSRFYHALESHLRPVEEETGEGLLAFYHDQIRFAAYRRYLDMQSPEEQPTDAFREAHGELARYFSPQPLYLEKNEKTPNLRKLSEMVYQMAWAGFASQMENTLLDFTYLQARLVGQGAHELIQDFALIPKAGVGKEKEAHLSLLQSALRLSAHVLTRDPLQLPGQLTGRLLGLGDGSFLGLLEQIRREVKSPWLRPMNANLTSPGGPLLRTLEGHTNYVHGVALTPDGKAVSASWDTTLKVWDIASGELLRTLEGHSNVVYNVAVTPDGRAVSTSLDNTLRVWDIDSGELLLTVEGHTSSHCVAVTLDGIVVSASHEKILVWDINSGHILRTLKGHSGEVKGVAVTSDGTLVSASSDHTLKVWDINSGRLRRTLEGHTALIWGVAVTSDGKAISASVDKTLKVWDIDSGNLLRTLEGHINTVENVAATSDGRAVSASKDHTLKVWDIKSGNLLTTFEGHTSQVLGVAVTSEGIAVSASEDKTLKVWDINSTSRVRSPESHTQLVTSLAVTPDGRVVSASWDETLKVWDINSAKLLRTLEGHTKSVEQVALASHGRAVSASSDETLKVWDINSGELLHVLTGHDSGVYGVATTPDGKIVSASNDETIKVWDINSGILLRTLEGRSGYILELTMISDGTAVAAYSDHTLKVWDINSGELLRNLEGHSDYIMHIAVTEDSKVVSASVDKTLKVWDINSGKLQRTLAGHTGAVRNMAVISDRRVVSASDDNTLKMWDMSSGEVLRTFKGHTDSVREIAVRSGGKIISASDDNTVRVWDIETGGLMATFNGDARMSHVVLASDGLTIIAGDAGGHVHFLRGLSAEAWNAPRLLSECPTFHEPLKCNPLVVDRRKHWWQFWR